jgi:predicted nuclease of predicted toxin-antitoxin system
MAQPFRLRLLFDELMSRKVADALVCLGKSVVRVGGQGQAAFGSSDVVVARSAKTQRRVLVTFNFDMVIAACDLGIRFVWFDQRGRSPTLLETAYIVLRQWEEWEQLLSDKSVSCVKAGRHSNEVLDLEVAKKRAQRRFQQQQSQRTRTAQYVANQQQQFVFADDEVV